MLLVLFLLLLLLLIAGVTLTAAAPVGSAELVLGRIDPILVLFSDTS
jgi:hypothetical protein